MPIQLVVENLNASIDDKVVLHDLAVTAQAGHILALMGKGGCGKSTFLRVINRMAEEGGAVVSGHIMLDNSSIFMQDISLLRQKVGMVFTEPVLFAGNILGNITAGLRLQGIKKKQKLEECAEETLGYMGILEEFRDLLYTDASYLNRSQAQLVCIARALALRPGLLLMDAEDFAVFAAYLVQWFHTVGFFYRAEEGAAGEAAFREVRSVPLRGLRPAMFLDLPPETLLEITDKQHTDRRSAARSKTRSGRHDGKENGL